MATFKVSTKVNKSAVDTITAITIVYDSPEAERALATQQAVVKWQGWARKHGIPAAATIKLSDMAPGVRHSASMTPLEAAKVMSPEERKQLIEQLKAMG
jgi:hypothetical protein